MTLEAFRIFMKYLLLLPLSLASCASISDTSKPSGMETYRYVNTLDFGKDNTLDSVVVTGHDERGVKEATRLDVKVGSSLIQLRDPYDGTSGGAMYHPSVSPKGDGALLIGWGQMGEVECTAEIVADPSGQLVERRRTTHEP